MSIFSSELLLGIVFLTIVFLHISRKNLGAIGAYAVQSIAIVLILLNSYFETGDSFLLIVIVCMAMVKVIAAPFFLARLIRRHALTFSSTTFLNVPLTVIGIAALTAVARSDTFSTLTGIIPEHHEPLVLALSIILLSLFLIANHKGALSQIVGILSLENSIVAFAVFAGLEQSSAFQIGILFDVLVWLGIATIFASMVFRHFGSLDVTMMRKLTD